MTTVRAPSRPYPACLARCSVLWAAPLALFALCCALSPQAAAQAPSQPAAQDGPRPSVIVERGAPLARIVAAAATVTPSPRQLAWQQLEFTAFVHFGMNTFTDREWGDGTEDPDRFQPTAFDADQWARAFRAAGMKGLVLTAKHHDGFCLWPTRSTEHSVRSSSWRGGEGDVVAEVAAACRRAGLELGLYLSPWDRNSKAFGTAAYNEVFRQQLRELLTGYGAIYDVWFDGANCPKDRPEVFDWSGHWALVRELQPGACISVMGPDVRWCGNEAGRTRPSEWCVLPLPTDDPAAVEGSRAVASAYVQLGSKLQDEDLGSRARLSGATRLVWYPAMTNTSIRPGWFYHPAEDRQVRPLGELLGMYYGAVGGNTQFLLNVPPDRRGLVHDNDVQRLRQLGAVLQRTFAQDLSEGAQVRRFEDVVEYLFDAPRTVDVVLLCEDIAHRGQRVEEFRIDAWNGDEWRAVARATTIGSKRLLRFGPVTARGFRVWVERSRAAPAIERFGLYRAPDLLEPPAVRRDRAGRVTIASTAGARVRYTLDGSEPGPASRLYEGPFALPDGGVVKATAFPGSDGGALDIGLGTATAVTFGIAKAKWRIHDCDSEQAPAEAAAFAIDADPDTIWHSRWSPTDAPFPHHLTIDFGETLRLRGFTYLPRRDMTNGTILRYRLELSTDGVTWERVVEDGEFEGIRARRAQQVVRFARPHDARYLRLCALSEVNGRSWASAAEVGALVR